jgi:hypothetical protein
MMHEGVPAAKLRWTGPRVPRDVELLDGMVVGTTQHGIVRDPDGNTISCYERLTDNVHKQEMLLGMSRLASKPAPDPGLAARRLPVLLRQSEYVMDLTVLSCQSRRGHWQVGGHWPE